ncbi:MAG: outer membrane beta-barrel protein, partial [Sulfurovum sp.]|nr:outer membrane beta-barrel protein [Sulfurovum sp.]
GKWTFETDVLYLKVDGELDSPLPIEKIQLRTWVVTPYAAYNVVESDQWNLDLLAGVRYLYMKSQITLPIAEVSDSDTSWNGIVGMKGNYKLNEKWYMPFIFNVGSGDADITYQALAGVGYKYENFDLLVGYRYLKWEFNDGFVGFSDLDLSGPIIGVKFRF